MNILTIDIETTGLPPKDADYKIHYMQYPYIASLAFKINGEKVNEFIINQEGRIMSDEVIAIHGITNEIANASPHKFIDVIYYLLTQSSHGLTDITVGHNIYFDSSIIKANVLRMIQEGKMMQNYYDNIEIILHKDRRIDTMKSTIKFCNIPSPRGAKWPKLTELYFKLFGKTFDAHSSGNDVDATYECFVELVKLGVIKLPEPIKPLA